MKVQPLQLTLLLPAVTLALTAGNSGTPSGTLGGSLTLTAGTASPSGQQSSIQILGSDTAALGGDIILTSTGQIVAGAAVVASQGLMVNGLFTAAGDIELGMSNSQMVAVNAQATFSSPLTANAAVTANDALTVQGLLKADDATLTGALTVHGNTIIGERPHESYYQFCCQMQVIACQHPVKWMLFYPFLH